MGLYFTGYGTQTALWVPRLAGLGYEMAISAFYGLEGARTGWNGIPVYPGGLHGYGGDVIEGHAKNFGADLVLTLCDPFAQLTDQLAKLQVAMWTPVDREPLGHIDQQALESAGARVIAMSRFGERILGEAGFDPLYVPHGIDTAVFRPPKDRAKLREAFGVPADAFVIGINATNKDPVRKGIYEMFVAFAGLLARHSDVLLLVHSNPAPALSGVDLGVMAEDLGISRKVTWADPYAYTTGGYTQLDMVVWYGLLDFYAGFSYGEGFGLPIIEAQACGVPVGVTNCSSMTELAGPGWLVDGEPYWHAAHRAAWTKPYVGDILEVFEAAYGGAAARRELARDFALAYDADTVLAQHWAPALKELEAGLAA